MEIASMIILSAIIAIYLNRSKRKLIKEHDLLMQIERNKQVHYFRYRLLHEFDVKIVKCMPSYTDMLWSDKPFIASEWVDIDKLHVSERIEHGELEVVDFLDMEFSEN